MSTNGVVRIHKLTVDAEGMTQVARYPQVAIGHWFIKRLRNKPHIYKRNGEWRVILRPDFDFQVHLGRRFEAHHFVQDRNQVIYSRQIEARWQTMG